MRSALTTAVQPGLPQCQPGVARRILVVVGITAVLATFARPVVRWSQAMGWQRLLLAVEMDVEEDGNVYIKQVVVTLKALNKDIDHNLKV